MGKGKGALEESLLSDTIEPHSPANSEAPPMSNRTLTRTQCFLFGISEAATAVCGTVLGFFLSSFLLEVARLPPSGSGGILLVGRIWDAITDPCCGLLTDRTRSRWGRRRPWLLFSAIPCGLSYIALWQTLPDGTSDVGRIVYYCLCYMAVNTTFTAYSVPYSALGAEIASSDADRNALVQYRMSVNVFATLFTAVFQGFLIAKFGEDRKGEAFSIGSIVCAVCIVVPILTTFLGVREGPAPPPPGPIGGVLGFVKQFFGNLRTALSIRPYLYLTLMYLTCWLAVQLVQSNLLLYIKHSVKLEDHFTYLLMTVLVSTFGFISLWAALIPSRGKKSVFAYGMTSFAIVLAGLTFVPKGCAWLMYIVAFCAGAGVGTGFFVPWAMLPNVIDADIIATGLRREGLFYSFFVFFQKMALGLGLALSGFALDIGGYDSDKKEGEDQDPSVGFALRILVGPIPAALVALSLVFLRLYPLDAKTCEENSRKLQEEKDLGGAGEADNLIEFDAIDAKADSAVGAVKVHEEPGNMDISDVAEDDDGARDVDALLQVVPEIEN